MNGWMNWKMAAYLAAIFLAGGVSGWVVSTKMEKRNAFKPPQPKEIATSLRDRLHAKLNLTPDQSARIDAIIERTSGELGVIHGENLKRIKAVVNNRNAQIDEVLQPEQQKIFEQMDKERKESWRNGKRGSHDGRRSKGATNSAGGTNVVAGAER